MLAHHAARGELWDKAARYQGQVSRAGVGARFLRRGDYRHACGIETLRRRGAVAGGDTAGDRPASRPSRTALCHRRGSCGNAPDPGARRGIGARSGRTGCGLAGTGRPVGAILGEGDNAAAIAAARRALEIAEQAGDAIACARAVPARPRPLCDRCLRPGDGGAAAEHGTPCRRPARRAYRHRRRHLRAGRQLSGDHVLRAWPLRRGRGLARGIESRRRQRPATPIPSRRRRLARCMLAIARASCVRQWRRSRRCWARSRRPARSR